MQRLGGRWHLASTIFTSFAASLLFLGLLGALSWFAAMRSVESTHLVLRSEQTMRSLNDFQAQMYRAFANQRGLLLTGDTALRERRDDAIMGAGRALASLERLRAEGVTATVDLANLRGLVAERAVHFARIDRIEAARGRREAIAAFALVEPEKIVGDVVGEALAAEERRLAARKASERTTIQAMYGAFAAIGCALVVGLALVYRRIHRELQSRERSDAVAREARERLQRALGASRMVLWETDLRADAVAFDRRLDDPSGELRFPTRVPTRELIELVYPDEREQLSGIVAQAVEGQRDEWAAEHRTRGPGGEWLWVLSRGRVTERDTATGRALRLSGISVDITERKLAEDQLHALNGELEAFSYSVSHDLRAPIRALDGFARLLEESDGARLTDEGRHFLGVIRANSRRMGVLVEGLLRLARVGREALNREPVDVAALARHAADELRARYPAARIEIGALPPARADRALLRQVLVNLLDNALKYSSVRPDPVVTVGAASRDGETAYFVRDNGAGFDPQYAGKLFEPFQRLHGAEFEGSGIGLAIVRRIVERHGGRVWAEGAPGQGATFHFTLGPAAR